MVRDRIVTRRFRHGRLCFLDSSPVASFDRLNKLQEWLAGGEEIKVSSKVEARLVKDEEGNSWFVKRYVSRSWFRLLLVLLGFNRGRRVFFLSCRLKEAGVRVPSPSACLVSSSGFHFDSWFVCEGLDVGKDLRNHFFDDRFDALGGVRSAMDKTAEIVAQLHAKGFVHYDLKWANFMVGLDGAFYLIDLDGMRRPVLGASRKMCRDVARFVVNAREFGLSEGDVDYWLCKYAMLRGVDVADIEKGMAPFYKKIVRKHRRKYNASI